MNPVVHKADDGYRYININVKFSFGPITMAQFLKLMHMNYLPGYREPGNWKIDELLSSLRDEVRMYGRTRIEKMMISTEEEELYFGCVEKYFPELTR